MKFPHRPDGQLKLLRLREGLEENGLHSPVDQCPSLFAEKIFHLPRPHPVSFRRRQSARPNTSCHPSLVLTRLPQSQLGRLPVDLIGLVFHPMFFEIR